jgi:lysophospholipase L1-like esterase
VGPSGGTPANYTWTVVQNGWWWVAQGASTTAWTTATSYMAAFTSPYTDGNASGSWKYGPNADASGATSVTGIPISFSAVNRATVYSGAASQPTVYFGSQGHASDFYLLGCIVYRNTAVGGAAVSNGLQIARHAFTGKTAAEFTQINSGGVPVDRAKAMIGGYDGSTYDAVGFPTCPHLLIYALGVNDNNRSQTDASGVNADPHTFMHSLRRVVEAGRRGRPDMSVLIILPHYGAIDYADNPSFAYNDSWVDYHDAAQVVAREYTCALLSMNARWGSTAFAQGFQSANDGHPTAAGYADMAAFIAGVL